MKRAIVHMDLDTFFVSCERLANPALEGKPLIIGGGSDRGVVASCSYEARAFGVRAAMPIRMAERLCPQAEIMRGDIDKYSKLSDVVTDVIRERAPVMEKASIDEFYLDVSGMDRFYGCFKWTEELAERVKRETGLPISFALSVNKTVSKIGTGESKPMGKLEIPEDKVAEFLGPLSVQKIPMLGEVTFQLLSRIGIRTIRTLSEVPVEMMEALIGKNGIEIWKKANGIDNNPVQPYTERKSISTETTFDQDIYDIPQLKAVFAAMVERLGFQMRMEGWLASVVTVKIRYNNFDTETKQSRISYTSCDHTLLKLILELFEKLYTRRMRLRLVGIKFGGLVRGSHQINMFEDTQELLSLYQAFDRIKKRFGFDAVTRCAGFTAQEYKRRRIPAMTLKN